MTEAYITKLSFYLLKKTVDQFMGAFLEERWRNKFQVFLSELREGDITTSKVSEGGEIAEISYRVLRAVREGIAKDNLRLMARILNGMNQFSELSARDFNKYADIVASLSREEIYVAARWIFHEKHSYALTHNPDAGIAEKNLATEGAVQGDFLKKNINYDQHESYKKLQQIIFQLASKGLLYMPRQGEETREPTDILREISRLSELENFKPIED